MKQTSKIAALAFSAMSLAACDFLDFDQSTGYDNQQEVYEAWARAEQSQKEWKRKIAELKRKRGIIEASEDMEEG